MIDSISVIAGNGELPLKVLHNVKKMGINADVIGIEGEYDRKIIPLCNRFESIRFYEIERGIEILKRFQNEDIIFVGGVSKIGLLNIFRPDVLKKILQLKSLSDENIFKGVINLISNSGFRIISFTKFYKEGIVKEGVLCGRDPEERIINDALYGRDFIKHNSLYSTGQSVIVKNENIVAVETIYGTDNMLQYFLKNRLNNSVFVKCSKDNQDMRIDLPSIGRKTID
ncbi:MAG: UDP-2,3-diacylglucosamine diphosphatase LpxI domain-containing protein, partial [Myxococcota bacterium]